MVRGTQAGDGQEEVFIACRRSGSVACLDPGVAGGRDRFQVAITRLQQMFIVLYWRSKTLVIFVPVGVQELDRLQSSLSEAIQLF